MEAIATKNADGFKKIMSSALLEKSGQDVDQIIEQLSSNVKNKAFDYLDKYYTSNSKKGMNFTLFSSISEENDYNFSYSSFSDENFISIIIPKEQNDDIFFALFYGKVKSEWKLFSFQVGQYKIDKKTAPEHYKIAKEQFKNQYYIDAFLSTRLAKQCLNPIKSWEYYKQEDIMTFGKEVQSKVMEEYTSIDTEPQIFDILSIGTKEGYFPMVKYISSIELSDTIALKEENDLVQERIGEVFTGIDKNKKYIFYKALNEMPNNETPVSNYGFEQKLN